jgi:hypothetical protein
MKRPLRKIDLLAVLALALVWGALAHFMSIYSSAGAVAILFLTSFLMALSVLMIKKTGISLLFAVLCGIITYSENNLSFGADKLAILLASSLVLEISVFILKKEHFNIRVEVILGSALSGAVIPVAMLALVSEGMRALLLPTVNFALAGFFVGASAGAVSTMLWYRIKSTRLMIKYEYMT